MADEPGKLDISDEMIAERRGGSGKMPEDMPLWMAKSITGIDKFTVMDFAIHNGISSGIFPKPPRLSAIISSDISSLPDSSAISLN